MERRNFLGKLFGASCIVTLGSVGLSRPYNSSLGISINSQQEEVVSNLPNITYNRNITKPKALQKGDYISIISPATSVTDPDDIQMAIEIISALGLQYKIGRYVLNGSGYKTRTVEERLYDLHEAFGDNEIKAVMAIRGGYGSSQLLDRIDYELIGKNPKIIVGYSDITALLLAINKFSNLVTFHGPVLLSQFTDYSKIHFQMMLFEKEKASTPLLPTAGNEQSNDENMILKNPETLTGIREIYPSRTIKPGVAEGILFGGNLSIICSLLGTPYEIDANNKILFLEDVGEEPYRVDRMLNQLRLANILNKARGIIFGKCYDCSQKSFIWDYSLGEVLDYYLKDIDCPSFYGLLIGHTPDQLTLPIGVNVRMDANNKSIELLEKAVV